MTQIKQALAPKGSACRPGYGLSPKFITIHNTGNPSRGAGAANHAAYLQGGGKSNYVSWHYAVDDKLITQSIPDNEVAWHAGDGGSGTGNRQSIAIEICENPDSNILAATNNAAELTAMLMKRYGIPISNVKQHNNWNGKNCPRQIRAGNPYNWDTFKQKVQSFLTPTAPTPTPPAPGKLYRVQAGAFSVKGNADAYTARLKKAGFDAFAKKDGNLYRVQAGAFSSKASAETQAQKLKAAGFDAIVV